MALSLEDIRHLSDEVSAIVRAGLPLEAHLADFGRGRGRRLQELTETVSGRLEAGESLDSILSSQPSGAPRMLAAAVAAGVRTGEVSSAIETLGDVAGDLVDLRRHTLQALMYPLTIVALATMMFVVFVQVFLSRIRTIFDDLRPDALLPVQMFLDIDRSYPWWPLIIPGLMVVLSVVWWFSGRAAVLAFRGPERALFLIPGVRGLLRDLQVYTLSRILALLVDRQTPLPDALQMAGACCGNSKLDDACSVAAARLRRGEVAAEPLQVNTTAGDLPPLLAAGIRQAGLHEEQLRTRLHAVTGFYRRRLQLSLSWLKHVVPILLFLILGGSTVLLYSLAVFWPAAELYRQLASS